MEFCQKEGHQQFPFERVCLNTSCQGDQSFICNQCMMYNHANHLDDCLNAKKLQEKVKDVRSDIFVSTQFAKNEIFQITEELDAIRESVLKNLLQMECRLKEFKQKFTLSLKNYSNTVTNQTQKLCLERTQFNQILQILKSGNWLDLQKFEKNQIIDVVKNATLKAIQNKYCFENIRKNISDLSARMLKPFQNMANIESNMLNQSLQGIEQTSQIAIDSDNLWGVLRMPEYFYEGEILKEQKNGRGVLNMNDGRMQAIIEGNWKQDELISNVTITFPDKSKYQGQMSNFQMHGIGEIQMANGDCYRGKFKNDSFNGKGTFIWINGQQYTGHWLNALKHGRGIYKFSDCERYEGEFVFDKFHGWGTHYNQDGSRYQGFYFNGQQTGFNKYYFANGASYYGFYDQGKPIGKHIFYNANNEIQSIVLFDLNGNQISATNI